MGSRVTRHAKNVGDITMMIDINRKWLEIFAYTPKEGGQWFVGIQVFRKRWEFGIDQDWMEVGYNMARSRPYLYAQHFHPDEEDVLKRVTTYQFPRKNRWTHVTG